METTIQKPQFKNQFTNVAGITFPSIYQANSLFTLSAWFKDGNKTYCHSWRQETRSKTNLVDHQHAYNRMKQLATVCTCRINSRNCFYCNHQVILIFCNLTDKQIFKSAHKVEKMFSDLTFGTSMKGSTFLSKINGESVSQLSVLHAKQNLNFYQHNNK